MSSGKVIRLSLDTSRDDKGKTPNYHVYAASETMTVENGKKQAVTKNAIMGGNGTIYIGNPIATGIDSWVLVPAITFDAMQYTAKQAVDAATVVVDKTKGRKKR